MKRFLFALVTGGALAYFLDPNKGGRRRSLVMDKVTSTTRQTASTAQSAVQSVGSKAQGVVQETVPTRHDNPNPDDKTLKDRVESEVLRNPMYSRSPINFNVVDGIVEIRGELESQGDIDALVSQVKSIRDVAGVHNYLHLPGTPAPNKEEAIRAS
jgi:osmotically-inducible protein OsmY